MRRKLTIVLLAVLLPARLALAQLVNENLLIAQPSGYKAAFQSDKNNTVMTEYVPAGETVDNWTEMLTVQVFHDLKTTPQAFEADLDTRWLAACPHGSSHPVASGVENGYPTLVWLLSCPGNPATGKPERTWIKAVQGNDSFYLVQKAFRFDPSNEQIVQWMHYLRAVEVCDTRLPSRACPSPDK